jgi:hypothetical protein
MEKADESIRNSFEMDYTFGGYTEREACAAFFI